MDTAGKQMHHVDAEAWREAAQWAAQCTGTAEKPALDRRHNTTDQLKEGST
jgi:hypothetical protein